MTEKPKYFCSMKSFTTRFCLFTVVILVLLNPQEMSHDRALQNWLSEYYHMTFTQLKANKQGFESPGVFLPSLRYYGERCYYRNYYIFSVKKYYDDDAIATIGIIGFVHVVNYKFPKASDKSSNP